MRHNNLFQLLHDNRASPRAFRLQASADQDEVTIYLYDVIVTDDWFGGVSAQSFVQHLASITADTIHLRINSPGGDVFAARAIETAIRGHSAKVIAHVDGVAASAASFVMLAADEVQISEDAFVMIHKSWTCAMGNADELKKTVDMLDAIDASMIRTYAKKTGQTESDIAAWMADETWFSASEAVEKGFAHRIAHDDTSAEAQANAWNLSAYRHAPAAYARESKPLDWALPVAQRERADNNEHCIGADLSAMKRHVALRQRL